VSGTFTGPQYSAVTGDLKDLKALTDLETIALGNSPLVTGDLASLSALNLKKIDFGASAGIAGDVVNLKKTTVTYANFAAASGISGQLEKLPEVLKYGNFRAARYLKGDVGKITTGATPGAATGAGKCALVELDIHSTDSTTDNVKGKLKDTDTNKAGLFQRCPNLKYVDLGNNYGSDATKHVFKDQWSWTATEAKDVCVKANKLATKACGSFL